MRTRLVEKLKQARVQRAGPYAGGRVRARSILQGAHEMFRTTDPNVAMMKEVPHGKRTFDQSEEPGIVDQDEEVQPKTLKAQPDSLSSEKKLKVKPRYLVIFHRV